MAETCCFDLILKNIHLLYIIRVVFFDYPPTYLVCIHNGNDTS